MTLKRGFRVAFKSLEVVRTVGFLGYGLLLVFCGNVTCFSTVDAVGCVTEGHPDCKNLTPAVPPPFHLAASVL